MAVEEKKRVIGYHSLRLVYKHTDLWLKTVGEPDRLEAEGYLRSIYKDIEGYAALHKEFLFSLHPFAASEDAPFVIQEMCACSREAGVGPMAGVAGVIAEYIGRRMAHQHPVLFSNNGGDIYFQTPDEYRIRLIARGSPFDERIELCVPPAPYGKGLCTSSGISGHSINMGRAFSVTILADNACRADVWATAISNRVRTYLDIEKGLELSKTQRGIEGVVILVDQYIGVWGTIQLNPLE